jgi:hypothetical protein
MMTRALLAIVGAASLIIAGVACAEGGLPSGLTAEAVQNAKTPDQHNAIAAAYDEEAKALHANADAHRRMDSYYNEPGYLSEKLGFKRHCRSLVDSYEAAAKEAEALAKEHRNMAEEAAKKPK